jgi:hypothetical protein
MHAYRSHASQKAHNRHRFDHFSLYLNPTKGRLIDPQFSLQPGQHLSLRAFWNIVGVRCGLEYLDLMRIDDLAARERKVHCIGKLLKQLLVAVTFFLVFGYPLRFCVRGFALSLLDCRS